MSAHLAYLRVIMRFAPTIFVFISDFRTLHRRSYYFVVLRQHNNILVTKHTHKQTQLKWEKQLESKCAKFVIPSSQL